jgi:hypothetical protein
MPACGESPNVGLKILRQEPVRPRHDLVYATVHVREHGGKNLLLVFVQADDFGGLPADLSLVGRLSPARPGTSGDALWR